MDDISLILSRIDTLSDDRKAVLKERFISGSLTQEDKEELSEHLLKAMDIVTDEVDMGKALLQSLSDKK